MSRRNKRLCGADLLLMWYGVVDIAKIGAVLWLLVVMLLLLVVVLLVLGLIQLLETWSSGAKVLFRSWVITSCMFSRADYALSFSQFFAFSMPQMVDAILSLLFAAWPSAQGVEVLCIREE